MTPYVDIRAEVFFTFAFEFFALEVRTLIFTFKQFVYYYLHIYALRSSQLNWQLRTQDIRPLFL